MPYPYPVLTRQLSFLCSPTEYLRLTKDLAFGRYNMWLPLPPPDNPYWSLLPRFVYARCPICHYELSEPLDVYSLHGWHTNAGLRQHLYQRDYPPIGVSEASYQKAQFLHCAHFLGSQAFFNLHEQPYPKRILGSGRPQPERWANSLGDVPFVTPWFLLDEIPSYVVLHAVPICEIKNDEFMPAFTLFSLTYFSQDRKEVLFRWHWNERMKAPSDPEYYPSLVELPGGTAADQAIKYDLVSWAHKGRLRWLDFTHSYLPLNMETERVLPGIYQNIQGKRQTYGFRGGL